MTDFDLRMYVIHLSTGADIHIPRNDGASPFYMACMQGWINIAKMLYAMDPRVINDRTINDCTPLWIAATHGHMEIVQWLVDCSRYEVHKGQKAKHKTFLTARAFRGMSVQKAARSRGQARIAAFIEWHLHTGDGERMSSAPCGKQAWVENLGQWADELPPGTPKVEPDDYGFDALNINCRGECSRDFSVHPKRESAACNSYFSLSFVVFTSPYSVDGRGEHVSGPRRDPRFAMDAKPRKKGGHRPHTTWMKGSKKSSRSPIASRQVTSGQPSVPVMNAEEKFGEAQNQMEHGLYKKAAFSFLDAYELAEEEQRAAQRKGKVSKKKQVDIRVASKMAMHNRFAAKNERQWTVQDESSWNLRQG